MTSEAAGFFAAVVGPTVLEFLCEPQDVRRGRLAAIVISHVADYLAMETNKPLNSVREELTKQCPAFSLIRDVADATKHAKLSRKASLSSSQQVTRSPGLSDLPFGEGLFAEAVVVFAKLNDGTEMELRPAIESAMLTLQQRLSGQVS
jgi:hypothetical protein